MSSWITQTFFGWWQTVRQRWSTKGPPDLPFSLSNVGEDDSEVYQKEDSDEVLVVSDKGTDGVKENRKKTHDDATATEDCKKDGRLDQP